MKKKFKRTVSIKKVLNDGKLILKKLNQSSINKKIIKTPVIGIN